MTLKEYKIVNKLTCLQLAEKFGVTMQSVKNWLSGRGTPNKRNMLKIEHKTDGAIKIIDWF